MTEGSFIAHLQIIVLSHLSYILYVCVAVKWSRGVSEGLAEAGSVELADFASVIGMLVFVS